MDKNEIVSVFGASGRVGKEVVKLALLQGFKVKAHCRQNSDCDFKHENLTVYKGDLTNFELIKEVIKNSSCVIVIIGQRAPYKDIFCRKATELITKAMNELGVKRIVCLSGAMIGENNNNLTLPFRIMRKFALKKYSITLTDRNNQEKVIKKSELEWTLVKPPRLVENGERNVFIFSETLPMGLMSKIGFDDLAEFLVEQIKSKDYLQKPVYVKY